MTDPRPDLVRRSLDLALDNVEAGGKPFACVVVDADTGEVLHEATNQVSQSGDKSAHAEITAIRELAEAGRTDLTGCDVYVTAYPCPMCLGALYYAAPERVVYAASREEEDQHYEDGGRYMTLATFYDEYAKAPADRNLPAVRGEADGGPEPVEPFRRWTAEHA
ncbi:nucleoside deaminase [Nocardioides sp. CFH 31398]|uniref:nucleoside deaminase n=1 Tax=Nocardioides sp. CFH 31398 TaxID=2919579 RepID=UPI001F0574EB|nr:nucleoside deaminase [Nocardioides sp. CFH 31398]MCH1866377.1 nucleoside deaminase [Nocardioides sp. CFH 31398]